MKSTSGLLIPLFAPTCLEFGPNIEFWDLGSDMANCQIIKPEKVDCILIMVSPSPQSGFLVCFLWLNF